MMRKFVFEKIIIEKLFQGTISQPLNVVCSTDSQVFQSGLQLQDSINFLRFADFSKKGLFFFLATLGDQLFALQFTYYC